MHGENDSGFPLRGKMCLSNGKVDEMRDDAQSRSQLLRCPVRVHFLRPLEI